jgi:hypothetical protein
MFFDSSVQDRVNPPKADAGVAPPRRTTKATTGDKPGAGRNPLSTDVEHGVQAGYPFVLS